MKKDKTFIFTASVDNLFLAKKDFKLEDFYASTTLLERPNNVQDIRHTPDVDEKRENWLYFKFTAVKGGSNNNNQHFDSKDLENTYLGFVGKPIDLDHELGTASIVGHIVDSKFTAAENGQRAKIDCLGVIYKDTVLGKDIAYIVEQGYKNKYLCVSMECRSNPEYLPEGGVKLKNPLWMGIGLTRLPAEPEATINELSSEEEYVSSEEFIKNINKIDVSSESFNDQKDKEYYYSVFNEINKKLYTSLNHFFGIVDITENYIRIRQKDPSEFEKDSFRTITISKEKGIKAIIGRLKGSSSTTVQSYLFDKSKWDEKSAKKWVEEHSASTQENLLSNLTSNEKEVEIVEDREKLEMEFSDEYEETFEGKKLSYEEREKLSDEDFALIQEVDGKKIRRFPIHDLAHARNALARLPQAKNMSKEEKAMVWNKIKKRWGKEIENMPEENPYKAIEEDTNLVKSEEINKEIMAKLEESQKQIEEKEKAIEELKTKLAEQESILNKIEEEKKEARLESLIALMVGKGLLSADKKEEKLSELKTASEEVIAYAEKLASETSTETEKVETRVQTGNEEQRESEKNSEQKKSFITPTMFLNLN